MQHHIGIVGQLEVTGLLASTADEAVSKYIDKYGQSDWPPYAQFYDKDGGPRVCAYVPDGKGLWLIYTS